MIMSPNRPAIKIGPASVVRLDWPAPREMINSLDLFKFTAVLTRVGVLQMPVECVAHELIVKAQTVIAKGAGSRRVKFLHDLLQTLEFAYAFCRQFVWCDARHQ